MRKFLCSVVLFLFGFIAMTTGIMAQQASLSFSPTSKTAVVGTPFTTEIIVNTAGEEVAGVGAKISYDHQKLRITKIEAGRIFGDYPVLASDNQTGRAHISGIVTNPHTRFSGQGVLATITFLPLQPGTSQVTYIYEPNSTTDSNIAVTHGNGDVLSSVTAMNVVISGAEELSEEEITALTDQTEASPPPEQPTSTQTPTSIWQRIAQWLDPRNLFFSTPETSAPTVISEDGELPPLPPRQVLSQAQPEATVVVHQPSFSPLLLIAFILVIVTLVVAVIVMWRKLNRLSRQSSNSPESGSSPIVTPAQPTEPSPKHDPQKPPPHAAHFR